MNIFNWLARCLETPEERQAREELQYLEQAPDAKTREERRMELHYQRKARQAQCHPTTLSPFSFLGMR